MPTNTDAYVADKLTWAHRELGKVLDNLADVIDWMHDLGEDAILTTLASDYSGLEATRRIIRTRRRELEDSPQLHPGACPNTYHLEHLRKHGACATCGERSE